MRRRQVLAGLGALGVGATAGCSLPGSETTISNPVRDADDDGTDPYLSFRDDDEEVASLGFSPSVPDTGSIRVTAHLPHRDGTELTDATFDFRMVRDGEPVATIVALVTPVTVEKPYVSATFSGSRGSNVSTVRIDDFGDLADETANLHFLVDRQEAGASTLHVDATVGLDGGGLLGSQYTLTGELDVPIPARGSA
ncbi:hypothetical protein ACFPYI_11130 [Halomarina salina]|uniref:DUF8121 domain-containing protein n=1 Tax=Halomarina salina TaxID=1872699 RepID=A0ABD5RNQ9_9EURY|nr:hypothetical protein [Halomarina salina]